MEMKIDTGFESESEYMKFSDLVLHYTRKKLVDEHIWDYETCTEKARDMATDAILDYMKQVARGNIILNRKAYVMKSIKNRLISRSFIKEKALAKQMIIVFNSPDESVEKSSFVQWQEEINNAPEENPEDYYQNFFNINKKPGSKLSKVELMVAELKDKGLINREVARELNLTEGYISKLVKKILKKITRNKWV